MRNEIGSEFWDIPVADENHFFPVETKWFVSGRSGLKAILSENSFSTASLPVWCCDSMIRPFLESGIKISFYTYEPEIADVSLVMDYFGYATDQNYSNYPGIIIRDLTHSLFSKAYSDADYYFGSLRKWAGFYTGGFAWGFNNKIQYSCIKSAYSDLRKMAMNMKAEYINEKSESKEYLNIFNLAETELDNIGIHPADERDIQAALILDIPKIKNQRRKNACVLLNGLGKYVIYHNIKADDCPMFVPILVPGGKRDELRRYLIQNEIYCPVHWPVSEYHHLDNEMKCLYNQELSIVCDQRYTENDMIRIVYTIEKFLKEGI